MNCKGALPEGSDICPVCGHSIHYDNTMIMGRTRTFWFTSIGALLIVLFSLFNWIDVVVRYGFIDVRVRVNFFSAFGDFDQTGLYFLLQDMGLYRLSQVLLVIFAGLMAIAIALLITSVIKHKSKSRTKFALSGFLLAASVTVVFMLLMVIVTGKTLSSGLTLFPVLIFALVFVALFNIAEPLEVSAPKWRKLLHQKSLFIIIVPIMVYVFVFHYLPLTGWQMAFQNFTLNPDRPNDFVGMRHFQFFFTDDRFFRVMRNTLAMSAINLVMGFVSAILLALLMNEIRQMKFKRVVQTISYLPHFLSWVIAAGLIGTFLASDGLLNTILVGLGIYDAPRLFRSEPESFWMMVGWSNVWKSVGWNTIIYLAAMSAIDPALYESADIDGAGRFAKMWHITLPGIKSTILVLLIMSVGWILTQGFELQLLLGNDLVWSHAETIDIFVIRWGIQQQNFSLATAVGMFRTVVSVILLTAANLASRRLAKESLV